MIKKEELNIEIENKKELLAVKEQEKLNYLTDKNSQIVSLNKIKTNEDKLAAELQRNNNKRKETKHQQIRAVSPLPVTIQGSTIHNTSKAISIRKFNKFKSPKIFHYYSREPHCN